MQQKLDMIRQEGGSIPYKLHLLHYFSLPTTETFCLSNFGSCLALALHCSQPSQIKMLQVTWSIYAVGAEGYRNSSASLLCPAGTAMQNLLTPASTFPDFYFLPF